MLARDNPGIPHIRKIYLEFEKMILPAQQNPDDLSDEENHPVVEDVAIAARQAQLTVRLLLDFLPPNILEVFRYDPAIGLSPRIRFGLYLFLLLLCLCLTSCLNNFGTSLMRNSSSFLFFFFLFFSL